MIKKNHNDNTKEFFKKILIFIDAVFTNTAASDYKDANKILINGIINVRDAIFAETIKDNQIDLFNQAIQAEQVKKNQNDKKESQQDSNQENESASDLQA